jgi:hypothetical protein
MQGYRAAGVLPLAIHEGKVYALFGSEPRRRADCIQGIAHGSVWWLAFGGKIERVDEQQPWRTALREFREESGNFWLGEPKCLDQCYDFRAKYALFIVEMPFIQELPTFSSEDAARDPTLNKRQLRWIPLDDVLFSLSSSQSYHLLVGDERLPVKPWFFEYLRRERHRIARTKQLVIDAQH